jgi:hypothetical protein
MNGACNSDRVISEFFNPSTRIAVTMRASFARTLGYNTSQTFVKGVIACDGRFVAVNKTDPINIASHELSLIGDDFYGNSSSSSPGANVSGNLTSSPGESRRLLLGLRRMQGSSASASPEPNVFLNSLNISLDGETLVVQLGVSVPAILAQSLAQYLSLTMSNASSASIAAAAAAVASIIASPAYVNAFSGGSSTNAVSPLLTGFVQNSASGGASALDLRLAMKNAIIPSLSLMGPIFNVTNGSSLLSSALPELIRVEDTNAKAQPSQIVISLPGSDGGSGGGSGGDSGTDLPLLGLLALIPIACCFAFFLWRRRSEDDKKKKKNILVNAQAKDLALNTVDSGSDDAPDGFNEQNPMYKDRPLNTKDSGAGEAPEIGVENLNAQAKDLALNTVDSGSDDAPESPTGGLKLRAINISFEPTSVA